MPREIADLLKDAPPEIAKVVSDQKWATLDDVVAGYQKASAAQKPWTEGFEPDDMAQVERGKWGGPKDLINSYRASLKHLGAPAEELFRLPKTGASAEELARLHAQLGVPPDEKGYVFGDLKIPEPIAPMVASFTKDVARQNGIPVAAAKNIVGWFLSQNEAAMKAAEDSFVAAQTKGREVVNAEWGTAAKGKMQAAQGFMKALGIEDEMVSAIESVIGPENVLRKFAEFGEKLGEYKVIEGEGGGEGLTRSQARTRVAEIQADPAFRDRSNPKQKVLVEEFHKLNELIHGTAPLALEPGTVAL